MIQELYSFDVLPGNQWNMVNDWLKKVAEVYKKSDLVVDAYALRPETGNVTEFNKAHVVVVFDTLADRTAYWNNDVSDEFKDIIKDNSKNKFVTEKWGHHYFNVIR